ncbi:ribosomal protection-like ABC-F family protein [Neobacillus cucumis]|uniref:ribosomal protection-like ABC-F family protein n=1 Tax=Neobacillus cucumis TaxID=1740721 RepID=UPI002E1D6B14|nr:ABC-F type ribosomal protection protein [Neobacillus cucumis]MED4226851.1 ABC-F type ribosomal protection protein [Neobacillus cucumis]
MHTNQKIVLKVSGVEKSFHLRKVLENIQFNIKSGDRIGLVGCNGSGKTTLAKILLGQLNPDKGAIEIDDHVKIGYLSQSIDYQVSEWGQSLGEDLYQFTKELGLNKVYDWNDERLLHLSGGEKLKLALSHIWSSKPDFLILDEPTNHLDFKGINWLITELTKFNGPVLIISHDRHFLDQAVTQIYELEHSKLHFYNGNYSEYMIEKQKKIENQQHAYQVQQQQIQSVEAQMQQLKSWSDKAHRDSTKKGSGPSKRQFGIKEYHRAKAKKRDSQIKSKMKRLENELDQKRIEKPKEATEVKFQFEKRGKRGKRIIEAKNLSIEFDDRLILFQGSQFYINHGERIGLLGDNGCGKTTLIKIILGEEPRYKGEIWKSDSLKVAYLSQDVNDLPADKAVLEALGLTDRQDIYSARTLLANLGLKEEQIMKPLGTLSLGERTRVKLTDMLMKDYDVLILDEPTNHLDLASREQLEKTLNEFTGTIITVSHDYYFLNKLCDRLLVFENQQVKRVEKILEEYINPGFKNTKTCEEELLIIENKIAFILGQLSMMDQKNPQYQVLDQEFNLLLQQKRNLQN